MADKSAIEWTDATWNPVTGCTKISAGCDNCYAERFAERFRGVPGHPYEQGFDLTLRPARIGQPLAWRRPRMIGPVMQILDGPVYIHQYKINGKAAFDGDVWQWHQDYGTWARDDLMPEARAMNVAVFLDDVTAFNGALMFIPKSHRQGVIEAGHDQLTTSYPLWTLDKATVTRLAQEGGIVAPTGPPGSLVLFHGNLVHASPGNISPFRRTIVYLSLCRVDNHLRRFKRPEWIAQRDFTPIQCLPDDCLLEMAAEAVE